MDETDRGAHAGAAGVAVVSDELGAAVGHAAIVAEWNTGQVVRVALASGTANGTSSGGTATPFLTGIQNPEPVVLGPDGALYVADWQSGTVYRVTTA